MEKEDKKLLFVLGLFIIGVAVFLIIRTNFFNSSQQSILFNRGDSSQASGNSDESFSYLIDINCVTKDELMQIDGIGEKTAQSIISYREKIGGFSNMEQLLDIDGIGDKTLAKLKNYLYVKNSVATTAKTSSPGGNTTVTKQTSAKSGESMKYPIDINTASVQELTALSGVGETRAKSIVEYREKNGGFRTIDEIKNVSGIGDAIFNQIKDYIFVSGGRTTQSTQSSQLTSHSDSTSSSVVSTSVTTSSTTAMFKLNINTATYDELKKIPKMTDSIAQIIINHRTQTPFQNVLELKMFNISDNVYNTISKYLTI